MPVAYPFWHSSTCNLGWTQRSPRVSFGDQYLSPSEMCWLISLWWRQGIKGISMDLLRVSRFESTTYIMGIVRSEMSAYVLGARLYGKEK